MSYDYESPHWFKLGLSGHHRHPMVAVVWAVVFFTEFTEFIEAVNVVDTADISNHRLTPCDVYILSNILILITYRFPVTVLSK